MPLESVVYFDQLPENADPNTLIDYDAIADEFEWENTYIKKPNEYINEYISLWTAVLAQAIQDSFDPKCYVYCRNTSDHRGKDMLKQEARRWLLSDDMYIGSYRFICEILDIDPWTWRDRVLCLKMNRDEWHENMNEFKRRYDRRAKDKKGGTMQ